MNSISTPQISVVTPTYNRAYIIEKPIKSVLDQTFRNFEYIIVDDGSDDSTESVVKSYGDERIRYVKQSNKGVSAACNAGWREARAPWVIYVDSDDELLSHCLEVTLRWLEKHPEAVFAIPRAERFMDLYENGVLVKTIDDSADTPPEFSLRDIFHRNAGFSRNGFVHRRDLMEEGIAWDEDLSVMEDWELMMQIGERHPRGFLYIPEVLYRYRLRYGTDSLLSQANYMTWVNAFEYIYGRHKNDQQMKGQNWYPRKVEKWRKLHEEFKSGERSSYQQYYFDADS